MMEMAIECMLRVLTSEQEEERANPNTSNFSFLREDRENIGKFHQATATIASGTRIPSFALSPARARAWLQPVYQSEKRQRGEIGERQKREATERHAEKMGETEERRHREEKEDRQRRLERQRRGRRAAVSCCCCCCLCAFFCCCCSCLTLVLRCGQQHQHGPAVGDLQHQQLHRSLR
jgi:hypothetical protein